MSERDWRFYVDDTLWSIVRDDIEPLIARLRAMLDSLCPPPALSRNSGLIRTALWRRLPAGRLVAPIFDELRGIVSKTFGLADVLRKALAALADRIQVAFVYGSVAKATDTASSDIDVMIISPVLGYTDVVEHLADAETRLGRMPSPTIYKPDDFTRKLASGNAFLSRVMDQPKLFLIGTDDAIPKSDAMP